MLVGNPNGGPATVAIQTPAGGTQSVTVVEGLTAKRIALSTQNTQYRISSDVDVIVQLALDTGKVDQTFVQPVF